MIFKSKADTKVVIFNSSQLLFHRISLQMVQFSVDQKAIWYPSTSTRSLLLVEFKNVNRCQSSRVWTGNVLFCCSEKLLHHLEFQKQCKFIWGSILQLNTTTRTLPAQLWCLINSSTQRYVLRTEGLSIQLTLWRRFLHVYIVSLPTYQRLFQMGIYCEKASWYYRFVWMECAKSNVRKFE